MTELRKRQRCAGEMALCRKGWMFGDRMGGVLAGIPAGTVPMCACGH